MDKKRIFLALPVSKQMEERILDFSKKHLDLPVRWVSGKNLHITLVPPWYEDDLDKAKDRLSEFNQAQGLAANFHAISYGPNPDKPRLIWIEGSGSPELINLEKELSLAFDSKRKLGPWKPHITIARFKEETSKLPDIMEEVDWKESFRSIAIMESHLLKTGAEYEILFELELIG